MWRLQCVIVWTLLARLLPKTLAFLEYEQMKEVVDFFEDTFLANGGAEFIEHLQNGKPIEKERFGELDEIFGIGCLLESIRPDVESSSAPPTWAYTSQVACLDDDKDFLGSKGCPEGKKIEFVDHFDASGAQFRYMNAEQGSTNKQGVFWTDSNGLIGSLLMSFAPSKDGGGLSRAAWDEDEFGISFQIRPAGDRIWATTGPNKYWAWLIFIDLIYQVRVTEGTDDQPTAFKIYFTFSPNIFPFVKLFRVHVEECLSWILDLDATLVTEDKGDRENSVIWRRKTVYFGFPSKYNLVQIVDGKGEPIEPAYTQWLDSTNNGQKNAPFGPDQPSIQNGLIMHTLGDYCDLPLSRCAQQGG